MNEEVKDFLKDLARVLDEHDVELCTANGIDFLGFFGEYYLEDEGISANTLKKLLKN